MTEHIDMVTPAYSAETDNFYGEVLRHKNRNIIYACLYSKPRPEPQDDDGHNLITSVPFVIVDDAIGWVDEALRRREGRHETT